MDLLSSRKGGILLHPSSLPSPFGIGELGGYIHEFLDLLEIMELQLWQILPLGPTGYGNSPYQSLSSFAGNPLLISIIELVNSNLLDSTILNELPNFDKNKVEFVKVNDFKIKQMKQAYNNFDLINKHDFRRFCISNDYWLDDYAAFMGLKNEFNQNSWQTWPKEYRIKDEDTIIIWMEQHQETIEYYKFEQFVFNKQWLKVKRSAKNRNISIIGDIPIYTSLDSADTWSNQHLFQLDENGRPTHIAGVPPDRFSKTGQRWGNPLYDWEENEKTNFKWWRSRIKKTLDMVDIVRLDHFRGFESYWKIPETEKTAIHGEWIKAPGDKLLTTIEQKLGKLPIMAEDLGTITEEVIQLREKFNLPGMKILQYGFTEERDPQNPYLPHNYQRKSIAYTGTHDNAPVKEWYEQSELKTKNHLLDYSSSAEKNIVETMIYLIWASVSNFAIVPMHDFLRLGKEGRMNYPGIEGGNWEWRFSMDQIKPEYINHLRGLTQLYGR